MKKKPAKTRKSALAKNPVRKAAAKVPRKHVPTPGLYGWITHTDLASADPAATKAWCVQVFGWTFMPSFPGPAGEIHLFVYSDKGGGGIRPTSPPEVPGSIPYVHVERLPRLASTRRSPRAPRRCSRRRGSWRA